jgi:hypothetical protein
MAHPTSVVPDASMSDLRVYFTPELDHLDHSVKVAVNDVVGTPELDPPDAEFRGRRFWPTPTDGMRWSRGAGSTPTTIGTTPGAPARGPTSRYLATSPGGSYW